MIDQPPRTVTIVGGGLAGLAAACALADSGHHVRLLERRPYVGGRASSYEHPGTGEVIDNCQHVLIGRCTNLIDLYRRLDALDAIRWYDHFTFIEPGGRRTLLQPSSLPAPLHTSLSFLRAPAFSLSDKLAIARGMSSFLTGIPRTQTRTSLSGLRATAKRPARFSASGIPSWSAPSTKISTAFRSSTPERSFANRFFSRQKLDAWAFPPSRSAICTDAPSTTFAPEAGKCTCAPASNLWNL